MNILCIGNSFSEDATRYLHQISNGEIYVANLALGGCSLERHYNNILENYKGYLYEVNGEVVHDKGSINEVLREREWDFVTIQQVSHFSGMEETYEPFLPYILGYIKGACPNAKIVFHRTWAYSDYSTHEGFVNYDRSRPKMFEAIVNASNNICKKYGLDIIPNGDAVEKARLLPEFDEKTHPITRDGFHLSLDYGRYLAGLVMFKYFTGKDATKVTYEPEDTSHEICQKLKLIAEGVGCREYTNR